MNNSLQKKKGSELIQTTINHNIRNEYSLGTIAPEHCKGVELFADMLTKPLGGDDHYKRCATHPGFDWGR